MKIEKLNHSKFKVLLYTLILGVVLIFIIVFQTSKASYRTTQSVNIASGSVSYSAADLNVVAIYLQDEEDEETYNPSNTIPSEGYELSDSSYCEINGVEDSSITIEYDIDTQTLLITPMTTKGTKCYLYFDIDNNISIGDIIGTVNNNCSVSANETIGTISGISTSNEGICAIKDGMYGGTTYYYRGLVNNNWIKFAGIYWRIIRINGDGSIRIIYSGTSEPTANNTESNGAIMKNSGTQVTTSAYNTKNDKAEYVGFYYTVGSAHGITTPSTIAEYLLKDNSGWYYASNLYNYKDFIDISGKFCNDRTYSTGTGIGNGNTTFNTVKRDGYDETSATPTTSCSITSDIFSLPVGLITSDEVIFAGGYGWTNNTSYYLYTGQSYWTMSPYAMNGTVVKTHHLRVSGSGSMDGSYVYVSSSHGVRPVINLKIGTKLTGSGTYDDVYKVVGTND